MSLDRCTLGHPNAITCLMQPKPCRPCLDYAVSALVGMSEGDYVLALERLHYWAERLYGDHEYELTDNEFNWGISVQIPKALVRVRKAKAKHESFLTRVGDAIDLTPETALTITGVSDGVDGEYVAKKSPS